VQWHRGQGQLKAVAESCGASPLDCVLIERGSERFSALLIMEYTQSAGAITLPPGIENTSKSNFEPALCQPLTALAATDSNMPFIAMSSRFGCLSNICLGNNQSKKTLTVRQHLPQGALHCADLRPGDAFQ
jgi:hypothetical protein